jgi:hypothetical protein
MLCDAPHGVQLIIAAIGVMSAPSASAIAFSSTPLAAIPDPVPDFRASVPHSPPPRVR